MDIFEYLPQLIVAYDGNDEFANLIHVKKANKDNDYFCPCCGGIVRPRALDSTKEQSHYYHVTGKCTKENQLHFFCKNWLFEEGSKFYIENTLFEVESIEIEKPYETPFGRYIPDVTVHTTSGMDIYFEMFFTNRKSGDDYFCKWDYLGNDVIEVNIKEYMFKTDEDTIPMFTYLYHNGICYSKPYVKRDLYANTIAKIKRELTRQNILNYKARIEQLDWFWQEIRNNKSKEDILETISQMEYDDMVSCYEIIKRKQCVSYLKNDVLDMINQKVISDVRKEFNLPYDKNVYFDLDHIRGRSYLAGIRLDIKTEHMIYNKMYDTCNRWYTFDTLKRFPKIVFSKNIINKNEIDFMDLDIKKIHELYKVVIQKKQDILRFEDEIIEFEKNNCYKVRIDNGFYTVVRISDIGKNEIILEKCYIQDYSINTIILEIEKKIKEINDMKLIDNILKDKECKSFIKELDHYKGLNCFIDLKYDKSAYVILVIGDTSYYYEMNDISISEFIGILSKCKDKLDVLYQKYEIVNNFVVQINACKNKFWTASISLTSGNISVMIDQTICDSALIRKSCTFSKCEEYTEENIRNMIVTTMRKVLKNMEYYDGCRLMEVRNEE